MKNESGASLKVICQWSQEKQKPVRKELIPCILTGQLHWHLIKFNAKVFKKNVHTEKISVTKRLKF